MVKKIPKKPVGLSKNVEVYAESRSDEKVPKKFIKPKL
jgi:hypothetical protein